MTAPTGWRCLQHPTLILATGGTRFEAALALHAKQQLHREQLTTISFTKMRAARRIRSF